MTTALRKNPRRLGRLIARCRIYIRGIRLGYLRPFVVALMGSSVLLVGIVMIVLPGPAILVIPLGIAILAAEFSWVRRMTKKVGRSTNGIWKRWKFCRRKE